MYCCLVSNLWPSGAIMVRLSPLVSVGSKAFMSRPATAARCASTAARNGGGVATDDCDARAARAVHTNDPAATQTIRLFIDYLLAATLWGRVLFYSLRSNNSFSVFRSFSTAA